MTALIIFLVIAVACVGAPVYAYDIAHTNVFTPDLTGTVEIGGRSVHVMSAGPHSFGVLPIGPTWTPQYFLGADALGRDVMSRTLYGGRTSLLIGGLAAFICCVIGTTIGLAAGYLGGVVDMVLSRLMDLIWCFPFYFLAIAIASVLVTQRLDLGVVTISGSSELVPTLIIAYVFIPYVGRPIRAVVQSVRERDFIAASVVAGAPTRHILLRELLPNVLPIALTLVPIMMCYTVLTEATLSFLGVGVQPPNASWGSLISQGQQLLYSRPWISLAPGLLLTITLVCLGVFGEAVRLELAGGRDTRLLKGA